MFIIYIILSCLFTLLCVYSLLLNPGEQGVCSGHRRHLIHIIIYKDGVESVLTNKDSVESPNEVRK